MDTLVLAFTFFTLIYGSISLALFFSWKQIGKQHSQLRTTFIRETQKTKQNAQVFSNASSGRPVKDTSPEIFISVIIPVRNEQENILHLLQDINRQDYSAHLFEVIVIDDGSEDETKNLVEESKKEVSFPLSVYPLLIQPGFKGSHKKAAISQGVGLAKGRYILNTDGDCRVQAAWLSTLARFLEKNRPECVAGPVSYEAGGNALQQFQEIEFAALIGTGAASLQLGFPNMCNGANLAFKKEAFVEIKGYEGNEHIHSGDDEFLMHKIFAAFPEGVHFLKDYDFCVKTKAKDTVKELFYQRRRWAGKWKMYEDFRIKLFAAFIFLYNLLATVVLVLVLAGQYPLLIFIAQIAFKYGLEFIFLHSITTFLKKPLTLGRFVAVQLVYPFYIVVIGVAANFGYYEWKGRRIG